LANTETFATSRAVHEILRENGVPFGLKSCSEAPTRERDGSQLGVSEETVLVELLAEADVDHMVDDEMLDIVADAVLRQEHAEVMRLVWSPVHALAKEGKGEDAGPAVKVLIK
jgi:hypothetical protein